MTPFWRTADWALRVCAEMQIRACVIKSYRGAVGYDDGNVDILVGSDEFGHIARRLLREESCSVGVWQRVRHRIYEPNKLMIDPPRPGLRRLHLHRSVGWHGIDVIESECVLRSAGLVRIGANHVSVPSKEMESLILVLHIVLETFEKSELDRAFIEESAFRCFGERYNVPRKAVEALIRSGSSIDMAVLWPCWVAVQRSCSGGALGRIRHLAYLAWRW